MQKKSFYVIAAVALLFSSAFLVSCGMNKSKSNSNLVVDGSWMLKNMHDADKTIDQMFPEIKPTAVIDTKAGRIGGSAGCNRYSGSIIVNGSKVTIPTSIAATKMMCATGMDGENVFLQKLTQVNSYAIAGNELTLMYGSTPLLTFEKK